MKKILLLSIFLVLSTNNSFADKKVVVPAIVNNAKTIVGFDVESTNKPLTPKELQALRKAEQWIKAKQYPVLDKQNVTFNFDAGQAVIVTAPLKLSVLELESGEVVMQDGIHIGDSARWSVSPTIGVNNTTMLIIKPFDIGLNTNLAVFTNKRTYHIRLVSRDKEYMPKVKFYYSDTADQQWEDYYSKTHIVVNKEKSNLSNPTNLNFKYNISGDNDFKPLRVYDNGEQVFIEMAKKLQEIPALFVVSGNTKQLVNYRFVNNYYIVDQLFNSAVLVLDVGRNQKKVTITKGN